MHNVAPLRQYMSSAQGGVHQGFQMLGTEGWQSYQPHTVVLAHGRSEVRAAVDCDLVAHFCESLADLFVIGFDTAVFRNHSTSPDESHPQLSLLRGHTNHLEIPQLEGLR